MVTVTATKDFEYRGRRIAAGDRVDVEPTEALVLKQRQQVSLSIRHKPVDRPIQTPKVRKSEPDLLPPEPVPVTVADPDQPRESASRRRRRNRYRRTDLDAPNTTDLRADETADE